MVRFPAGEGPAGVGVGTGRGMPTAVDAEGARSNTGISGCTFVTPKTPYYVDHFLLHQLTGESFAILRDILKSHARAEISSALGV